MKKIILIAIQYNDPNTIHELIFTSDTNESCVLLFLVYPFYITGIGYDLFFVRLLLLLFFVIVACW